MLGPLQVWRDGTPVALPASRKVRALLAYLALAPHGVPRTQLCELLWELPNDPRGELRWCLSKVRGVVDGDGRARVQTRDDTVRLDLSDCFVDAIEVSGAIEAGIETLAPERRKALVGLFAGDLLDGLEIDRSPAFGSWLTAQRRRYRAAQIALLEHLARSAPDPDALEHLEAWLRLAPFDRAAHELLLAALARRGRIREGEEHLATTARLFDGEGLDIAPLREAWRAARSRANPFPRGTAPVTASDPAPPATRATDTHPPSTLVPAHGSGIAAATSRRASIAVMPFVDRSGFTGARGGMSDALAHDVITRLAKLRSLFVIAQGSVFALHDRRVGPEEAGRMLDVDYVVSGTVRRLDARLAVAVELAETRNARIVWAEIFNIKLADAFLMLDQIGDRIVASIASEVETVERNRAILLPPDSLDAWEAHHRGLWHMYRFSRAENERARHFFETAVRLDPTFSRAYAGLSFTHFQNAFQGWAPRQAEVDRAFDAAGRGLMVDDRDPSAHWAMGRALWLRGRHDHAIVELDQAIDLSPNFALAHYTLSFVHSQAGDPLAAIASSDHSRHLSPFDPLLFGMLGARAMALVRLGRFDEAAEWGIKAAARPNAHAHIRAIAALSLALADRLDEARVHVAAIHGTMPGYRVQDFLAAMQFAPDGAALFRQGAARVGMG